MAQITTKKTRLKYPIGTGERALSHRDINVLGAEQGAIAEFADLAGILATQTGRRIYLADAKAQSIEAKAEIDRRWNAEFDSYDDNPDYSTYNKSFEQTVKGFTEVTKGMTNPIGRKDVEQYITGMMPVWEKARNAAIEERMKIGLLDSRDRIIDSIKELDLTDPSALAEADGRVGAAANLMREHGGFSEDAVQAWTENTLNFLDNLIAETMIENIKPDLIDAISVNNNREDGYKVLDESTEQLVKKGILSRSEAAEANKRLGDWIDNYTAGRIKAAKEADKLTTTQAYQKMFVPILKGELSYEDIENSDLRKTRRSGESVSDEERWKKYIKGSYKDAPAKNTPEGHTVSFAAVYDAATLQLSPKEAYDVLLEARFVDQSITNEQFQWAMNKIEKPYPKHVLEDMNAIMKSNLEDFNRLFSSDVERNKKTNEALISWVDAQIEQGKTPTKKEMYAMSSAFRIGGAKPYDIGAVIERGGQQWEIIGFDEDGEPLVELVP